MDAARKTSSNVAYNLYLQVVSFLIRKRARSRTSEVSLACRSTTRSRSGPSRRTSPSSSTSGSTSPRSLTRETLDLLALASVKPITNAEARQILKLGKEPRLGKPLEPRQADAAREARPRVQGLPLRGAPRRGAVAHLPERPRGRMPNIQGPGWAEVLRLASDGVRMSYERGKIDQSEFAQRDRMLKEMEAQLDVD